MTQQDDKIIAEFMGLCWHEAEYLDTDIYDKEIPFKSFHWCPKCGLLVDMTYPHLTGNKSIKNPDYHSNLSPRKLLDDVEKELEKKGLWTEYIRKIFELERLSFLGDPKKTVTALLTADAPTRCKAIVEVIRGL